MNQDHVRYADWDAAYVIRALDSADRRRYEAHLDECPLCRQAVGELAPTLGLLARVPSERAQSLLDPAAQAGPRADGRDRLVARGRRDRHRRRVLAWAGAAAAAAVLAIVAIVGVTTALTVPVPAGQVVALEPVTDVPLSATVELTSVAWGTRLDMVCDYPRSADPDAPRREWPYVLVVTATDGTTSELSTWRAGPGSTARLEAGTALDAGEIASIEVRSLTDDRVLLRGSPDGD